MKNKITLPWKCNDGEKVQKSVNDIGILCQYYLKASGKVFIINTSIPLWVETSYFHTGQFNFNSWANSLDVIYVQNVQNFEWLERLEMWNKESRGLEIHSKYIQKYLYNVISKLIT